MIYFFSIGVFCLLNDSTENVIYLKVLISLPLQENPDDPPLAASQAIISQSHQVNPDDPRLAASQAIIAQADQVRTLGSSSYLELPSSGFSCSPMS